MNKTRLQSSITVQLRFAVANLAPAFLQLRQFRLETWPDGLQFQQYPQVSKNCRLGGCVTGSQPPRQFSCPLASLWHIIGHNDFRHPADGTLPATTPLVRTRLSASVAGQPAANGTVTHAHCFGDLTVDHAAGNHANNPAAGR